jgi:preprotein translocase subunit Sss1
MLHILVGSIMFGLIIVGFIGMVSTLITITDYLFNNGDDESLL